MPGHMDELIFSTDEKYLYEISKAVATGNCPQALANKMPGMLHHARWLTKASRVLRLYVSSVEPSKKLIDIVWYIMKVYVPIYFGIKCKKSVVYSSIHFFNVLKYARYLSKNYFDIVKNVCKTNFYSAHPENLLLAMIFDDDPNVREKGYMTILRCREKFVENTLIREYTAPKIIFNESTEFYHEMIDWNNNITEPPFTRSISSNEITRLIHNKSKIPDEDIILVPNHIQATERHVKLVTEVAKSVATKKRREGIIAAKIFSRQRRPKFDSKKDF